MQPVFLRQLTVDPATHPRGQAHLSSASGLVRAGGFLYCVADDEHHLGVMELGAPHAPLRLHRIRAGDLPMERRERKRRKPDLEALVLLPPLHGAPHGALLAIGSGSRPNRAGAVLVALRQGGEAAPDHREVDLSALHAPLQASFPDLNIESAFLADGAFHLLQRANAGSALNACIRYDAAAFLAWLARPGEPPPRPRQVSVLEIGCAAGVPFGFTDAAAVPGGGWVFSAVAEETRDSYADGRCVASALGLVFPSGEVRGLVGLAGAPKIEGIAVLEDRLLLVTDADDPAVASQLLQVPWPLPALHAPATP